MYEQKLSLNKVHRNIILILKSVWSSLLMYHVQVQVDMVIMMVNRETFNMGLTRV